MGLLGNLIEPNPDNGLLNLSLNLARAGGSGQPFMGGLASAIQQTQQDTVQARDYQRKLLQQQLRDQAIESITDPTLRQLAYIDPEGLSTVLAAKLKAERGWGGDERTQYQKMYEQAVADGSWSPKYDPKNERSGGLAHFYNWAVRRFGAPQYFADSEGNVSGLQSSNRDRGVGGVAPADGTVTSSTTPTLVPLPPGVVPVDKSPKLTGDTAAASARGTATGKDLGENEALLANMQATYPELIATVEDLSRLGKTATNTMVGRGVDWIAREGFDYGTEGAVAREEYMSRVRDVLLPLLRQTFGAQFTENEGLRLEATLGDPNKTSEEKDAALRSFVIEKGRQIESLGKRVNNPVGRSFDTPAAQDTKPMGRKRYNPQTRTLEAY